MYRSLISLGAFAASLVRAAQPNILFVLTDDQDIELGSLDYLPAVTSRIQQEGFTFNNHYATVALCCPSRVAMLRGQQAHNTNNTNVQLPGGSFQKFQATGENDNNLPHYLKRAGYRTEFIGKIMNGYAIYNYETPPAGWDRFDGMLDPWMYTYNTPVFSIDGATPRYYEGSYLQDVVRAKAVDRVEQLTSNPTGEPWFLVVAPTAPHQTFNDSGKWPPVPAARHANLFQDVSAPRTPNFNPATNDKPSWVGKLPLMNSSVIERVDEVARARAQTLQSVDETVAHLIDVLEEKGELDNTVIVYSADHGYHLGVDESEWPSWLDGRSLVPYFAAGTSNGTSSNTDVSSVETINVEYWGNGIIEISNMGYSTSVTNNSYKTARIISKDYSYMYAVWCTGESELYDTVADPYELNPIKANSSAEADRLTSRLNGLMLLLKTCIGDSCRAPWSVLHPDGSVRSLSEALDPRYDLYYSSLPSVRFEICAAQYNLANEAPFFSSNYSTSLGELTTPHQDPEDYGVGSTPNPGDSIGWNGTLFGAVYEPLEVMEARARDLTSDELDWQKTKTRFMYMS